MLRPASGIITPDVGDVVASAGAVVPRAKARAGPHRLASGILVPYAGEGLGAAEDPDRGCDAVAGPSTLQALFSWPRRLLHDIAHLPGGLALINRVNNKFEIGIKLTIAFSGSGAVEASLGMIERALFGKDMLGRAVVTTAAVDVDRICQMVLCQHPEHQRPRHVFSDFLERLPRELNSRLVAEQ